MFHFFKDDEVFVKMWKLGKKNSLLASQEGLYLFVGYKDGKNCQEQDNGARICILKDNKGQIWQKAKQDLQIYHAT